MALLFVAAGDRVVVLAQGGGAAKCSATLIDEAYRSGQIDYETRLVQQVLARCRLPQLQNRFQSAVRPPLQQCGTSLFHAVNAYWRRLSPRAQQTLAPIIRKRPVDNNGPVAYSNSALQTLSSFDSPGGGFKVWYVRTSSDAPNLTSTVVPGVPDWVVRVANAFDAAKAFEEGVLGYRTPPNDFPAPSGFTDGGDSRFDVFLADIVNTQGALGEEVPERPAPANGKTSIAFLILDNDFQGTGFSGNIQQLMEVTAAHEYHHAIQDGYDTDDMRECNDASIGNFWFHEATSSWIENTVYPTYPKFYAQRLPRWFASFNLPLDIRPSDDFTFGDHANASAIFEYYLEKKFGRSLNREVWEALAADKSPDIDNEKALDNVLRAHGSTLAAAFQEFLTFNYITGSRDDGLHYRDGSQYPLISIPFSQVHSNYPANSPKPIPLKVAHLGSNYAEFDHRGPKATEPSLSIIFDGQDSVNWGASLLLVKDQPLTYVTRNLPLDQFGRTVTPFVVNDFDQFDRAILVVGVSSLCGDAIFDYNYCAFLGASTQQNANLTFSNVVAGATVWNMISNPLTMANTDPTVVFGNNIALANFAPTTAAVAPNQKTASGFIFVNFLQNPPSPPSEPLRFRRGRGFFLRTTAAGPVTASGTLAISCLPADIPLNDNNWTIIGNPFFDDMPWNLDQILINVNGQSQGSLRATLGNLNRAVEPYGWYWNPLANSGQGKYELVFDSTIIPGARASLSRGDGMFIKTNTANVTLTMNQTNPNVSFSPVLRLATARPSATTARSGFSANGNNWSVELKANAGSVSDEGTLIGKTDSVLFSRGIQVDAPPPVADGAGRVAVSLLPDLHSSRVLKADVHGAGSDHDAWNVVVTSDQINTEATLTWPNLSPLPRAQRMTLMDLATGQRLAMRTNTQYGFRTSSAGTTTRLFRIELAPAGEGGIRFSAVQTSSLGAGVHLSYVLNHDAQVTVRIVSPSGKIIRTLPTTAARTGLNTATWDGKAQAGLTLARGVYLIEVVARDDEGQETRALKSVAMK